MEMSKQKQDRETRLSISASCASEDTFYQLMEHERQTTQLRMKLV